MEVNNLNKLPIRKKGSNAWYATMHPQTLDHVVLFLLFTCFYVCFLPGKPLTVDSKTNLDTVRSFSQWQIEVPQTLVTREGKDNKHYSLYGPLLPMLSLPSYFIGILLGNGEQTSDDFSLSERLALSNNSWITALIIVLLYHTGRKSKLDTRINLTLSVGIGISTLLLPYSRDFFNQPLAALCILSGTFFLRKYLESANLRDLGFTSFSLGCAYLTRPELIILVPVFLIWFLRVKAPNHNNNQRIRRWVYLVIPFLGCFFTMVTYNYARWGSILWTPYQKLRFDMNWLDSIPRFFWGTDLNVILYNPILALAFCSLFRIRKQEKGLFLLILSCDVIYLLLIASFQDYHGGICPGPRYLVTILPLNLVPLFIDPNLRQFPDKKYTVMLVSTILVGGLINLYEASVDYTQSPPAYDWIVTFLSLHSGG